MTHPAAHARPRRSPPLGLFVATVFVSASLVFLVQPMVTKLVLPLLGGSSSVWNTAMAFFQIALLVGYGYAHALQRLTSLRAQALVHGAVLLIAALALPLRISTWAGPPTSDHPNLWLLAVLTLSIGAPFAVLSATAPLVQAWYARTLGASLGREPYALYAASNLGSLVALLAYPIAVEPLLSLTQQRYGWSFGYGLFALLIAVLAFRAVSGPSVAPMKREVHSGVILWRERAIWIALAAIPSSLMLGVTTYITTDIASTPFLWVLPLALYLASFVVAFQDRPAIHPALTLTLQGAAVAVCAALLPFRSSFYGLQLLVQLSAFFLTALMCHQRLVARRPDPERLTEFYFCLSLGGVVGGGFNAFLAPVIFNNVWEYPLVLTLACLARPWWSGRIGIWTWALLILGVVAAVATPIAVTFATPHLTRATVVGSFDQSELFDTAMKVLLVLAVIAAFLVRRQALFLFAIIGVLSIAAEAAADRTDTRQSWRSFFGVLRLSETSSSSLGGRVKMLAHGTTLHGAQAQNQRYRCQPLVYYAPRTPIGQVFQAKQAQTPHLRIGAVGLGTGSVAAYARAGDRLTFFEIDPLVVRIANDPKNFSYTTECAKGDIDFVVGDARLTVGKQPDSQFDILLIDAFSSDAVPAHLLTVEAVRGYLTKLKPDGVLILHLSNRNLDLMAPAQAVARAAGGWALAQSYRPDGDDEGRWESPEDAVVVVKSHAVRDDLAASGQWTTADPFKARPWTDDYMNLAGALYSNLRNRLAGER
jgi:SAM-dependent methyltransferase